MKKYETAEMFDDIAPKYDFLNRLLSFRIDVLWRRRSIKILEKRSHETILDVATGTGDLALACMKMKPVPKKIIGIDVSEKMKAKAVKKIEKKGYSETIEIQYGDGENIRFEDNTFDVVTVAFGVRNFENPDRGLSEMLRVARPGGTICILEFSTPKNPFFGALYKFYSFTVLPATGRLFSGNAAAYDYLPESIVKFPCGSDMIDLMKKTGYVDTFFKPMTFGTATIYIGSKPQA